MNFIAFFLISRSLVNTEHTDKIIHIHTTNMKQATKGFFHISILIPNEFLHRKLWCSTEWFGYLCEAFIFHYTLLNSFYFCLNTPHNQLEDSIYATRYSFAWNVFLIIFLFCSICILELALNSHFLCWIYSRHPRFV